MVIKTYSSLPQEAKSIRIEVFVDEQGFREEFDNDDATATHFVGFIDNNAVATARVLKKSDNTYLIGHIAVKTDYRKMGLGAEIIKVSEEYIRAKGGKEIFIHSQLQVKGFYEKQGYIANGETDFEGGCHRCMMKKTI